MLLVIGKIIRRLRRFQFKRLMPIDPVLTHLRNLRNLRINFPRFRRKLADQTECNAERTE
jgi:hypothetical protein